MSNGVVFINNGYKVCSYKKDGMMCVDLYDDKINTFKGSILLDICFDPNEIRFNLDMSSGEITIMLSAKNINGFYFIPKLKIFDFKLIDIDVIKKSLLPNMKALYFVEAPVF